jgi:hypothetical protein
MLSPGGGVDGDEADCDGSLGLPLLLEAAWGLTLAIDFSAFASLFVALAVLSVDGFCPDVGGCFAAAALFAAAEFAFCGELAVRESADFSAILAGSLSDAKEFRPLLAVRGAGGSAEFLLAGAAGFAASFFAKSVFGVCAALLGNCCELAGGCFVAAADCFELFAFGAVALAALELAGGEATAGRGLVDGS